jgi:alcohol dehydrogenase
MPVNANFDYFDFILPTKVTFGPGKIEELPMEIKRNGYKKIAIVTNVADEMSGVLEKLASAITNLGTDVKYFTEVISNPHLETVAKGVYKLEDFSPDCLIGIGGGSALDCAKAIGLCLAHGTENIKDLMDAAKVKQVSIPTIAVPTTAGTGSEVDYWAVISDRKNKEKISIGYPEMSPHMALVDPQLTATLPPELTLWTGIDALTHGIEAYSSSLSNRLSDLLSMEAISLVSDSLGKAMEDGNDLRARGDMSLASLLAGAAMQHVGLGLIHAMSHQVSGFYNTPHGLANAKLLYNVFSFNCPAIPDHKKSRLDSLYADSFLSHLRNIEKRYGIADEPVKIREVDIDAMARRAVENVNAKTNPRRGPLDDIVRLYRESFTVV